jgi:hypothetical protein
MSDPPVLLVLDLGGTFAFALNGGLTAVRAAHLDIVGVITLGMITAVGGGIIRDVLLGALPPATFVDWRYLAVAAGGGLIAFLFSRWRGRFVSLIDVLDAAGLSLGRPGAGNHPWDGHRGGWRERAGLAPADCTRFRLWSALHWPWPPTAAVPTTCSAYRWHSVRPWCAS